MFINGVNMALPRWVEKIVYWLSDKEKVQSGVVSKEGNADSLLRHEQTNHYWFPWKKI